MTTDKKEKRGFASMSPEKQREICSKGGTSAHTGGLRADGKQKKQPNQWTGGKDGTAAAAGRKGGKVSRGGRGRLPDAPAEAPGAEKVAVAAPGPEGDAAQELAAQKSVIQGPLNHWDGPVGGDGTVLDSLSDRFGHEQLRDSK